MNRREFLVSTSLALPGLIGFTPFAKLRTTPPNIILILADDWGYGALGCYGNPYISTPNLDSLATGGLRFTQAYSPAPVCAPTRWAIMTGQHCGWSETATNNSLLYPGQPTIASQLKQAGYRTGLFGKWGINNNPDDPVTLPTQFGFDAFLGYRTHFDAWEYYPPQLWQNESLIDIPPNTYTPDLLTQQAITWMGSQPEPFFLYFPTTLPHANGHLPPPDAWQVPPGYEPYASQPWTQTEKNFAAMHSYLDDLVGQLVQAAPANTLIIFAGDNGTSVNLLETAGGLRDTKSTLYEGGIRVPLIVKGPGIASGVEDRPAWLVNFSQVALSGDPSRFLEPEPMYWGYEHFGRELVEAVRLGDFKGVRIGETWELFNLADDPGETTNLAGAYPETIDQMAGVMSRYCPDPKICRAWLPAILSLDGLSP